jgi:aminoglycoside phosphotransferase (APT) family kinase protein
MDLVDVEKQIDPSEALVALGYPRVSELERVSGGWATLLWRFKTKDGFKHVLRIYHQPSGYEQEVAWRERLALKTCLKAGLPVPRVEKTGEVNGFPAVVLSWCPGVALMSFIEKKPWAVWRWGCVLGETQARVHAVTPPSEFIVKAPADWVSRVPHEYSDVAAYVSSLNLSTDSLIHLDFHPLNVIISNGATVTGIIDWTGAAAGDPRADLARTEVTILTTPLPPSPIRPLLKFARKIFLRGWLHGYVKTAGFMPNYRPFKAWAGASFLAEMELFVFTSTTWATKPEIEAFCEGLRKMINTWAREVNIR